MYVIANFVQCGSQSIRLQLGPKLRNYVTLAPSAPMYIHTLFTQLQHVSPLAPNPGMVMIGGGEGAVNATLETTSGDTVTLTCSLDQLGNDTLTFTWSRQGGRALPHGSDTNNGERGGRREEGVLVFSNHYHMCSAFKIYTLCI